MPFSETPSIFEYKFIHFGRNGSNSTNAKLWPRTRVAVSISPITLAKVIRGQQKVKPIHNIMIIGLFLRSMSKIEGYSKFHWCWKPVRYKYMLYSFIYRIVRNVTNTLTPASRSTIVVRAVRDFVTTAQRRRHPCLKEVGEMYLSESAMIAMPRKQKWVCESYMSLNEYSFHKYAWADITHVHKWLSTNAFINFVQFWDYNVMSFLVRVVIDKLHEYRHVGSKMYDISITYRQ